MGGGGGGGAGGVDGGGGGGGCSSGGSREALVGLRLLGALRDACRVSRQPTASAAVGNILESGSPGAACLGLLTPRGGNGGNGANGGGGGATGAWDEESLEPLLALRCSALAALRRPRQQAAALAVEVAAARRGGRTAAGLAAAQVGLCHAYHTLTRSIPTLRHAVDCCESGDTG